MILSLSVACIALIAASPSPPPKFVRVVVLDVSGSMAGERIRVAREELAEQIRQLPPSSDFPVIVAPFAGSARPPQTFTDGPALEKYLASLWIMGGTSIASGLESALKSMEPYRSSHHLCVMLYTDGEDSDKASLAVQEKRLDALFDDRDKRGLKQTVVFCKRWGGASASLVAEIAKGGSARVIDAGSLKLTPVTVTPNFRVNQVAWTNSLPPNLEVQVDAALAAKGGVKLAPVRIRCTTNGAAGDVDFELNPGGQPKKATVSFRESKVKSGNGGKFKLRFELADITDVSQSKDSLVLPITPVDHVELEVDVPAKLFRGRLSAQLSPDGEPNWSDPEHRRVLVPLELSVKVETSQVWDRPVHFQVIPGDDCKIVGDSPRLVVTSEKGATQSMTIETSATPPQGDQQRGVFAIGLVVASLPAETLVKLEPAAESVLHKGLAPKQAMTTIASSVRRVSQAQWTDLGDATAYLTAEVEVTVDGSLSPGSDLILRCPSTVKAVQIKPTRLKQGKQTVVVQLWARLRPAPAVNHLSLHIVPPAARGAVTIGKCEAWLISVPGPIAPRLVLSRDGSIPSQFSFRASDSQTAVHASFQPVLLQGPGSQNDAKILAQITLGKTLAPSTRQKVVAVNQKATFSLPAPDARTSFFQDQRRVGVITVSPNSPTSIVQGSKQQIEIVAEAPFKRLLFYLSISLGALLAFALLVHMWGRLRTVQRPPRKSHKDRLTAR